MATGVRAVLTAALNMLDKNPILVFCLYKSSWKKFP
jgi:hypothetical protein